MTATPQEATPTAPVTLDDKYTLESGRVFLNGVQALVRLPLMQRQRDDAAGLNTACYISGYRGSPLGGLAQQLWQARRFIEKNHIKFQAGINEDLAATAIWGSQQVGMFPTGITALSRSMLDADGVKSIMVNGVAPTAVNIVERRYPLAKPLTLVSSLGSIHRSVTSASVAANSTVAP